jgi:predicted O-methyltransferase YrrM
MMETDALARGGGELGQAGRDLPTGARMTAAEDLIRLLYRDRGSPFAGFPAGLYALDGQGWNSDHPLLARTVREARPRLVVEIGVWKGASAITLARALGEAGGDGAVLAVDTWLGSAEHWIKPNIFPDLKHVHGYPHLYYTFLSNVVAAGVADRIVPLPIDSAGAHGVLTHHGLRPDVIHVDAGHDAASVRADLTRWWERLAPGGWLIADDYDPEGKVWPAVRDAVDAFLAETPHEGFEQSPYKCRFRKPAA